MVMEFSEGGGGRVMPWQPPDVLLALQACCSAQSAGKAGAGAVPDGHQDDTKQRLLY